MTQPTVLAPSRTSEWKSLLGFLPEAEALNAGASVGVPFDEKTETAVREGLELVKTISGRKGLTPRSKPIPTQFFEEREQKLRNDPTFGEHVIGVSDLSFRLVEIGRIHAFQPHINLEYIKRLSKDLPKPDDTKRTVQFCLPLREESSKQLQAVAFNAATNTFTMASENLDMRILGQVQGEDPQSGRRFLGFLFGGGLRQISVVEYKGIVMLKNGYHRAYALLEKGHEYLPCLYLKTENYQYTGAVGSGFFPFDLMLSDKSPIMSDFFTKAAVTHRRPLVRMIISIHGEAQVVTV